MPLDAWELASWDATTTRKRVAAGEISAKEVLEAAISRAEQSRALNAVVTETFDVARERLASATGPWAALPWFLKDLVRQKGVRTAWGTAASGTYVATKNDPSTEWFEAAGLLSLGKTSTPEFGITATTEPLAFGACRNPWNLDHATGGSSGGAAALVAAGVVPMAHASDGGGSIRIPASCCGLVGLKVTRGRFDMEGSKTLPVNVAVHGVVTRTVRDTVEFWRALEEVKPPRLPRIGGAGARPARRLKVGVFFDPPVQRIKPTAEVRGAVEQTAELLKRLGHEVREVLCPAPAEAFEDFVALWCFLAWVQPKAGRMLMGRPFDESKLEPLTQAFAQRFADQKLRTYMKALGMRKYTAEYRRRLSELGVDVLLCPTLAQPAPVIGHLRPDQPYEESIARLSAFTPYTGMFNTVGAPAISLPLARSSAGLPIGIQFGAQWGQEALLLELAAELEEAQPWPQLAPRRA